MILIMITFNFRPCARLGSPSPPIALIGHKFDFVPGLSVARVPRPPAASMYTYLLYMYDCVRGWLETEQILYKKKKEKREKPVSNERICWLKISALPLKVF